ncbi:MAG: alpha/beta fold hydrolase, partial [Paracoccaceae bacterium]
MRAVFGLLLLLGSCVGGPMGPPPPAPLQGNAIAAEEEGLALSVWEPGDAPRAIILAVHGYGDYGPSTFDGPARYWASRGFTTYAYDQRGFGRNESRGRWPGADALIADFREMSARIRRRHPGLPLFVVGHSMGGAVAIAGVADGAEADGLILAAPAVWGGSQLALPYRGAAWGGALLFPDKRWTGEGLVSIQASDNIEALIALGRDPL